MRTSLGPYAISILTILLSSCAVIGSRDLNDLSLVSIQRTNLQDHPEITWLSNSPRPSEPLIEILVETSTNLANLAIDYEYNVFPSASTCEHNNSSAPEKIQIIHEIYDSIGPIDSKTPRNHQNKGKKITYHIFAYARSIKTIGYFETKQYNLINNPSDICIKINGGNMLKREFTSNTIYVKKSDISDLWEK